VGNASVRAVDGKARRGGAVVLKRGEEYRGVRGWAATNEEIIIIIIKNKKQKRKTE
jgi:hypothetical protein